MARWFHPDRAADFQNAAQRIGAIEAAVSEMTEGAVRIRIAEWSDKRGWKYSHRVETHLAPNGLAPIEGDRFVALRTDVVTYKPPNGQELAKHCVGSVEFTELPSGATKVSARHQHTLSGGGWMTRRRLRKLDTKNTEAVFRDAIDHWPEESGSDVV